MAFTLHIALAVRVLPSPDARGKDLGLMYNAIYLPLILSPLIGGLVLNLWHNFALLFALAALSAVLAGVLLLPVRSVR